MGARPFPFDPPAGVEVMVKLFQKLVLLSWSDHRVVVEVGRALDRSFKWVFIVYPDVTCFGDLGDLGG